MGDDWRLNGCDKTMLGYLEVISREGMGSDAEGVRGRPSPTKCKERALEY